MTGDAAAIPPGAQGLVFLPCLQGAMAPEWNGAARGVFYGLTLAHTRQQVRLSQDRADDACRRLGVGQPSPARRPGLAERRRDKALTQRFARPAATV